MSVLTNKNINVLIIQKGISYHGMAYMHSLLLRFFHFTIQMLDVAHCLATYFLLTKSCFLRFMELDLMAIRISHLRSMIGKADFQLH